MQHNSGMPSPRRWTQATFVQLVGVVSTVCLVGALPRPALAAQGVSDLRNGATPSQRASGVDPDERVQILSHVLATDSSAQRRRTAAWGLSRYAGEVGASDALVNALGHDASADVRETAAWSLARARPSSVAVTAALAQSVRSDASEHVRATAAWAIGTVTGQDAVGALIVGLGDSDPDVRERAIWALGTVERGHAPRALDACLSDANPRVRELAAWSLRSIGDRATIEALQSAFRNESDEHVRVADMHALNSMGNASLDAIRSILESPDKKLQAEGINALADGRASGPWPWPWPDPRPFP